MCIRRPIQKSIKGVFTAGICFPLSPVHPFSYPLPFPIVHEDFDGGGGGEWIISGITVCNTSLVCMQHITILLAEGGFTSDPCSFINCCIANTFCFTSPAEGLAVLVCSLLMCRTTGALLEDTLLDEAFFGGKLIGGKLLVGKLLGGALFDTSICCCCTRIWSFVMSCCFFSSSCRLASSACLASLRHLLISCSFLCFSCS